MGSKHASCLCHLPPHIRHRFPRLHQKCVCRRPGGLHDLPYTRGASFFALSEPVTSSGSRQAATTCSVYARACTSHHGGSTFWTSPDRRHGSPLHRAAAAPLFMALPQLPSSSCHRWWKAPFEGDAQLEMAALRIAHDGFGLGFEFRAQPICIKR